MNLDLRKKAADGPESVMILRSARRKESRGNRGRFCSNYVAVRIVITLTKRHHDLGEENGAWNSVSYAPPGKR
jgi:hypothetical protein